MSEPNDPGNPPDAANEHDRPTLIDVRPPSSSAIVAVQGPLVPLSRLGDYELLREIGRGGMGVVFEARHTRLGRVVALKMILGGGLAPAEDLHRFDTEVAAAAQLQHPGIVALYEVNTQGQQPYFSMEYISGSNLAQRLALGPMANRRAAGYLEAVARAVHHAHTKSIIHRDLKPANVLLDEHDQPKVTDFGLAKLLATDSGQTRTGAILGTPSYMAPEQAEGRREIGPATDVWSLGAILYELLTGRPPFRGESAVATLQQVVEKDPVPPRLFDPAIDRDLETICLKCLEKEPARRYRSAEALADDLKHFLGGEPIQARRVGVLGRAIKLCRRQPALASLTAFTFIAIGALMIFLALAHRDERRQRTDAEQAQQLAQVREEAMRHLLYLAEVRRAQQALEQADFDRVQRLLKHWEPRPGQHDLREWEWHFLHAHSQGRYTVHAHPYQATAVAWRPDGKQFASAGGEPSKPGQIKLWDAATGKLLATLSGHKSAVTSVAWHPHKELLASASFDATIKLWDAASHKQIADLSGHRGDARSVAFSPQGDLLASAGRDKTVRLWNVEQAMEGKAEATMLSGHDGEVNAIAFAPRGDVLASASADKTVRLWSLSTKTTKHLLQGHGGAVECLAFSGNGNLLASGGGSQRGEVRIWTTQSGQLLATRFGLSDRVKALSFNNAGLLAAGGHDGLVHIWDQAQTSEGLTFRAEKQVLDLAFSPDGRTLAVAGTTGRVSLFSGSGSLASLRLPAPGFAQAVAFNPVGSFLAATGPQGVVRAWNLDHPEQPITFAGHADDLASVAFSPNGETLAVGDDKGVIRLHDFRSPDQKPTLLTGHGGPIHALVYAPDGSFLASASDDDTVRLWDLQTATPRRVLAHGHAVRALAVSPDGHWLAAGGVDLTVTLWNVARGTATRLHGHTGTINALAFNPGGTQLASGSSDRTIRLWSVADKKAEMGLEGLSAPVQALAFHPSGQRLASIGQDKTLRVWDLITRQEILELDDPAGLGRSLAFSHDGRWLAAPSAGGVCVWDSGKVFVAK